MRKIYWPSLSILGPGSIKEAVIEIKKLDLKKALIVTDNILLSNGICDILTNLLKEAKCPYSIFSNVFENPTTGNVHEGLEKYINEGCDYIISLGGGSPQDAAKAIAILVTNGGNIVDFEGIAISKKKCAPIIAINTTSGTASEVTINYVITDENRKIKMVIVDPNCLPLIAVNDPELMISKPSSLTAATGMDALTHAIESYVTKGAYTLSDALSLESIKLIGSSLKEATYNGTNLEARSQMAWASYIAGLSFSNCGLGLVHSMAHQLGAEYNIPHGIANAILLPEVMEYNLPVNYKKFSKIAEAMGENICNLTEKEAAELCIKNIRALSESLNIPKLKNIKFNPDDINKLSFQAFSDLCTGGNPKEPSIEDIKNIYLNAYNK